MSDFFITDSSFWSNPKTLTANQLLQRVEQKYLYKEDTPEKAAELAFRAYRDKTPRNFVVFNVYTNEIHFIRVECNPVASGWF